jgi:hypothetical protein
MRKLVDQTVEHEHAIYACTCPNQGKPINGYTTYYPNCEIHRLFPLYERDVARPIDRGWKTLKKQSSHE